MKTTEKFAKQHLAWEQTLIINPSARVFFVRGKVGDLEQREARKRSGTDNEVQTLRKTSHLLVSNLPAGRKTRTLRRL